VAGTNGVGHLDRVDPATMKVVGRYPIEWWSEDVATAQGKVYVRGSFGGDITRINIDTGAVQWTQPGPGFIGRQGIDQLGATATGVPAAGATAAASAAAADRSGA